MSSKHSLSLLAVIVGLGLTMSADVQSQSRNTTKASAKYFCWDTPTGRKCGDTLPPEAAGSRRSEISTRTGAVVNEVQRAKTPEELAQEKWDREAQERTRAQAERLEREVSTVRMRYDSVEAIRQDFADRRKGLEVGLELAQEAATASHSAFISALDTVSGLEMEGKPVAEGAFARVSERFKEWQERRVGVETSQSRLAELDVQLEAHVQMWLGVSEADLTLPAPTP